MKIVSHLAWFRAERFLIVAASVALLAGCGQGSSSDSRLRPVTGTVSVAGKPLTKGIIRFTSQTDSHSSSSQLDSSGRFTLMYSASSAGAIPGEYQVAVEAWETDQTMDANGNVVPGKRAVQAKYFDPKESGLTAVVKADAKNDFKFNLD